MSGITLFGVTSLPLPAMKIFRLRMMDFIIRKEFWLQCCLEVTNIFILEVCFPAYLKVKQNHQDENDGSWDRDKCRHKYKQNWKYKQKYEM